ncbi:hypothetical protein Tco_1025603, partial [Tanacetum coccineum]
KPEESDGFEGIIDFLNASSIRYALTVNPTIYTSCIKQLWATAKAKTVNGEVQIQALVDGKKVIITETSVIRALQLKDAEVLRLLLGTNLVALWPQLSSVLPQTKNSTFPMFLDKQVEGMTKHKEIYVTPSHTKKVFANMKREGKGFSGRVTPLFQTMMVQAPEELGEGSEIPTDPQHTPTIIQPSTSQPQKKQPRRKQRKDTKVPQPSGSTEPITDEAANEEHVPTHSNDPLLSGEDRLKLNELIELCTNWSQRVLDLENTKTSQDVEITKLKERVKKLDRRNKSRTPRLKRLRKGRKIDDLDADAEVTKGVVEGQRTIVTTAGEVVTTASATTTVDELTLAQTLIEIKAAKPKAITTSVTTITTDVASTRPKAKVIVFYDQEEQASAFTPIVSTSQLPQAKDKGKGKMVEPEKPLKKKDQIALDEEFVRNYAFLTYTNEVSTASGDFGVSTAGGTSQVPSTICAHDVAYSFFAQPTTSPQLENEDF